MNEQEIAARLRAGREFLKCPPDSSLSEDYRTDQQLRLPQPPLFKPAMSDERIDLPREFSALALDNDILQVLTRRKSSRVYTGVPLTLTELSFLLWATQGVKGIRGKKYATLRTVPCGGARHEFECYLAVRQTEGLAPGLYHYMPDAHAVERLGDLPAPGELSNSLMGQAWAEKAGVVLYYSCLPYRSEWRYGIEAHRPVLMDAGHITENLYIACSALVHLGTCAVAAVDSDLCDALFGLDGEEEFIFYAAPVGSVSEADQKAEQAFYAFVEEEGL